MATPDPQELTEWLLNRMPATVAASNPEITIDDDEVLIVLNLNTSGLTGDGEARAKGERELIERRRNETKGLRMAAGRQIGHSYGRAVSWGMRAGSTMQLFTNNTAPVMTRLSRDERHVLDTLITAGVANTRSGALSYVVRAFTTEHKSWLDEVQDTMARVAGLRDKLQTEPRQGPPPMEPRSDQESGSGQTPVQL
jgi:hypothetical protein